MKNSQTIASFLKQIKGYYLQNLLRLGVYILVLRRNLTDV